MNLTILILDNCYIISYNIQNKQDKQDKMFMNPETKSGESFDPPLYILYCLKLRITPRLPRISGT